MPVQVKVFASLSEELGFSDREIQVERGATVGDVWKSVTSEPVRTNLLCAINQSYAGLDQPVTDGDEVAFFPPVNGG